MVDLTDTVSTAKVAKELTTAGKVGDAAGKVSATLSYGNNFSETVDGNRSVERFALDTALFFTPKVLQSDSLEKIAPKLTKISRSNAANSVWNAGGYTTNKILDTDESNDKY